MTDVFDAIVLAGGSSRRLDGADKPALEVGGVSLLARAVGAVQDAGRLVVVGPRRDLVNPGRAVTWCQERPPGGGPVAALAAALPHTSADVVIVCAADLPWISAAIEPLLGAVPHGGAALLVDAGGRVNFLAAAWRRDALVEAVTAIGDARDASMRALLRDVPQVLVPDPDGWGVDCDTWSHLDAARRQARLRR